MTKSKHFKAGDKVLCWGIVCTIYVCSNNSETYIIKDPNGHQTMVNKRLLKKINNKERQ